MGRITSSDTIKELGPMYSTYFDTVLQHHPDVKFSLDKWVFHFKMALLLSKHIYVPDNVLCDHLGMVKLFFEGMNSEIDTPRIFDISTGFFDLVKEEIFEGYPALIFGVRRTADTLSEALSQMLSGRMNFSILRNSDPSLHARIIDKKCNPLSLGEFLDYLTKNVRFGKFYTLYIKAIDEIVSDKKIKIVWPVVQDPENYKRLVLNGLNSLSVVNPDYNPIIERIKEEISSSNVHTRSHYHHILDNIAMDFTKKHNRYSFDPTKDISSLVIDSMYNFNIVLVNNLKTLSYDDSPYRSSASRSLRWLYSFLNIEDSYELGKSKIEKGDLDGIYRAERELIRAFKLVRLRDIASVRCDSGFRESINGLLRAVESKDQNRIEEKLESHLKTIGSLLLESSSELQAEYGKAEHSRLNKAIDIIVGFGRKIADLYELLSTGFHIEENLRISNSISEFLFNLVISPNISYNNIFLNVLSETPTIFSATHIIMDKLIIPMVLNKLHVPTFTKYLLSISPKIELYNFYDYKNTA